MAACHRTRIANSRVDGGFFEASLTKGQPPHLAYPYPTYRNLLSTTAQANSVPFGANQSQDLVIFSHNEFSVTLWYDYQSTLPSDSVRQGFDQIQLSAMQAVTRALSAARQSCGSSSTIAYPYRASVLACVLGIKV